MVPAAHSAGAAPFRRGLGQRAPASARDQPMPIGQLAVYVNGVEVGHTRGMTDSPKMYESAPIDVNLPPATMGRSFWQFGPGPLPGYPSPTACWKGLRPVGRGYRRPHGPRDCPQMGSTDHRGDGPGLSVPRRRRPGVDPLPRPAPPFRISLARPDVLWPLRSPAPWSSAIGWRGSPPRSSTF